MSVPWSEKVYQISNHDKYSVGVFFVPLFVWSGASSCKKFVFFSVRCRKMCLLAPSSSIILCPMIHCFYPPGRPPMADHIFYVLEHPMISSYLICSCFLSQHRSYHVGLVVGKKIEPLFA